MTARAHAEPDAAAVTAPVGIGALGGSGTRVYARFLEELGLFIGTWRNGALDNLLFSALFKEAALAGPLDDAEQLRRAGLFQRYMEGSRLTPGDLLLLGRLVATRRLPELRLRLAAVPRRHRAGGRWGWKEPNTQLFLEPLARTVPDLRYVHVVRHGLDMALSSNQNQLRNFGARFDLGVPDDPARVPERQLDYWIASTRQALAVAGRLLPDRHLVSRFDDLCARPHDEVARIVAFLGVTPTPALVDHLAALVEVPPSLGRHRDADLGWLRDDQREAVAELGFAVPAAP